MLLTFMVLLLSIIAWLGWHLHRVSRDIFQVDWDWGDDDIL